ncbi:hypothetical protein [Zhihengliuella halotolerans]|uniref:hypothetical protein n=1 Tax=Zhihengliuella halotolerans TaxID=370736 RepID=UPI000C807459|nr:hypothetical protein [Zhihengliuella halotolerans]
MTVAYTAPLDTSGFDGWPSADAIRGEAGALRSGGSVVAATIEDAADGWGNVQRGYRSGEGREPLVGAMALPLAHGMVIERATDRIAGHLEAFADEVQVLCQRRQALWSEIEVFNFNACTPDAPTPGERYESRVRLQGLVNSVAADFVEAAETCAALIRSVDVTEPGFVDAIASREAGVASGVVGAGLKMSQFEDHNFMQKIIEPATILVHSLAPIAVVPSGTYVSSSEGVFMSSAIVYQRQVHAVPGQIVSDMTWTERTFTNLKPQISSWLFDHNRLYRDWVEKSPTRWQNPSAVAKPPWWRLDRRAVDFVRSVKDAKGWTRAAKVAGPLGIGLTAAATYSDEHQDAQVEVRAKHADWSQEQVDDRAAYEAAVKGTTKVGIDLGAGAAGAAIGTVIGGPIGTIAGFAIGITASYVLDHLGWKDGAADVAVSFSDWSSGAMRGAASSIGEAWEEVF